MVRCVQWTATRPHRASLLKCYLHPSSQIVAVMDGESSESAVHQFALTYQLLRKALGSMIDERLIPRAVLSAFFFETRLFSSYQYLWFRFILCQTNHAPLVLPLMPPFTFLYKFNLYAIINK